MIDINCEVIQDLLPLYIDGCCSESSRNMVEEHLTNCQECKQIYLEMLGELPLSTEPAQKQPDIQATTILSNGFKKIRRRWIASLVAVAVAIPLCFLGWNQIEGRGICFTNLHELWIANAFLADLQKGDYEAAYKHIDIKNIRELWLKDWDFDEEALANIDTDGLEYFCAAAQNLIDAGGITEYHYLSASAKLNCYELDYVIVIDEVEFRVSLDVSDNGVEHFSGPALHTEFGQLSMWSENLWQHYEGCYFDWETGQYVYYDESAS